MQSDATQSPVIALLAHAMETLGHPPAKFEPIVGAPLKHESVKGYLCALEALTGNADIGLTLALHTPIHASHPLMYLMMSSANLEAAVEGLARYAPLVVNRPTDLALEKTQARNVVAFSAAHGSPHYSEYKAALLMRIFRYLVDRPALVPIETHFTHPSPRALPNFAATFGERVLFDQPRNALVFSDQQLALRSQHAAPTLHVLHEKALAQELPLVLEDPLLRTLREAIEASLHAGPPSLSETARKLAMSERTLQRRVSELGTDYIRVVEEARRSRSLALLSDSSNSIASVAQAAGYTNASSFHRAFRRWTGVTPSLYRERLGVGGT